MNKKIRIGSSKSTFTITDRLYKGAGGEASIYVNGGMCFKMYHDPAKKIIPIQKMKELAVITNPQVVLPKDVIYDATTGEPLGYTTNFVDNAEPLLKLFTKTFKQDNNIDAKMVADLIKQLQLIATDIHLAKCLIVDFNELNELVTITPHSLTPWFIDTDSYATPSFKATAIMDSVRDRRVTTFDNKGVMHYNPDEMSDWFSWGILAFFLYTNIHPYRGNHPKYKPRDKQKQMDDGISVFHKDVRVPPCIAPFNTIPKRHLDWFKDTFLNNNRSVPPFADSSVPLLVPAAIITVKGTNKIDVIQVGSYSEPIHSVSQHFGLNYVITQNCVYRDNLLLMNCGKNKKTVIVPSSDGTMVAASILGTKVTFSELTTSREIGTIASTDMLVRNGCVYTNTNNKMTENAFTTLGIKTVHRITEVENLSAYSTTFYEGCAIQNLLGKQTLVIPYKKGSCFSKYIPQLDGYRIVEAKSDKWVTVIVAEKKGQFDRFIIVFNKDYTSFDVRKVDDVAYDTINFTVMDNGLCALLASPTELELFVNNQKVEVLEDPPFDSTMKLFSTTDGIYFINGNSIHQIKKK